MWNEAAKLLHPALQIDESNPAAAVILAMILEEQDCANEARTVIERALARIPDTPPLSAVAGNGRDPWKVIHECRKEVAIFLKHGYTEKAIEALAAMVPHYPGSPAVLKKVHERCSGPTADRAAANRCLAAAEIFMLQIKRLAARNGSAQTRYAASAPQHAAAPPVRAGRDELLGEAVSTQGAVIPEFRLDD